MNSIINRCSVINYLHIMFISQFKHWTHLIFKWWCVCYKLSKQAEWVECVCALWVSLNKHVVESGSGNSRYNEKFVCYSWIFPSKNVERLFFFKLQRIECIYANIMTLRGPNCVKYASIQNNSDELELMTHYFEANVCIQNVERQIRKTDWIRFNFVCCINNRVVCLRVHEIKWSMILLNWWSLDTCPKSKCWKSSF